MGLSIEGHHLSLNFVMQGNKILDSTPQFFATNPAELKDDYLPGTRKGLRVLKRKSRRIWFVGQSGCEQKKQATHSGDVPQEIRAAGEPQPPLGDAAGLSAAKLKPEQKEMLKA